MRTRNKVLALLLCAVLTIGLLAGCSSKNEDEGGKTDGEKITLRMIESLTSPNISIGIGLSVQATITNTVIVLCTVVLITWSPRSISYYVIDLLHN